MGHPNADAVRAAFDAQTRGDWDAVRGAFADDVVFHVAGDNRFSGTYRGKEEVFALFDRRRAEWRTAGMYHMRDGRIAEAWGFNEDQQAVDQFWS